MLTKLMLNRSTLSEDLQEAYTCPKLFVAQAPVLYGEILHNVIFEMNNKITGGTVLVLMTIFV